MKLIKSSEISKKNITFIKVKKNKTLKHIYKSNRHSLARVGFVFLSTYLLPNLGYRCGVVYWYDT